MINRLTEQERRQLAAAHGDEIVEGSGVAVTPRDFKGERVIQAAVAWYLATENPWPGDFPNSPQEVQKGMEQADRAVQDLEAAVKEYLDGQT